MVVARLQHRGHHIANAAFLQELHHCPPSTFAYQCPGTANLGRGPRLPNLYVATSMGRRDGGRRGNGRQGSEGLGGGRRGCQELGWGVLER